MIIPITVTQSNINSGLRKDAISCPTALTLKYIFPNVELAVMPQGITIEISQKPYYKIIHKFGDDMNKWICDFDAGRKVYPVTFGMEIAQGIAEEWGYKGARETIN